MKDGVMVRTLEELQGNFDVEKLIGHLLSGKLHTWLKDRHYEEQFAKIKSIDATSEMVLVKMCKALEIDMENTKNDIGVSEIAKRQERIKIIRQYTDEKDVIDRIDNVAMNQTELNSLLNRAADRVYLYGEEFHVAPDTLKNVIFVGINNPTIIIQTEVLVDFDEINVHIQGCRFDTKYLELLSAKRIEEENQHKKKRTKYAASSVFDYMLSDDDRNQSKKLFDKVQDELTDFEFDIDAGTKKMYQMVMEADVYDVFDIERFGKAIKVAVHDAKLNDMWESFLYRIS